MTQCEDLNAWWFVLLVLFVFFLFFFSWYVVFLRAVDMGKSDSLITDQGERSDVATAQRYYEKKDFSLPKNRNNDLR